MANGAGAPAQSPSHVGPGMPVVRLPPTASPGTEGGPPGVRTAHVAEGRLEALDDRLEDRVAALEKELNKAIEAEEKAKAQASQKFSAKIFGRINADAITFDQDEANKATLGDIPNGTDLRRLRLGVMGEGFEILSYRLDVDFVTNDPATQKRPTVFDCYLQVQELPVLGNVRVGHFREPFSLERMDSTNDIPYLERSLPVNTFAPFRNLGLMAFDHSEARDITWALGTFRDNSNEFAEDLSESGGQAVTGRATWLPWYDEPSEGRYLLHLGASFSWRDARDEQKRFSQTPEAILHEDATSTPRFIDTGVFATGTYQIYGMEASTVCGPWSVQAECLGTFVDQLGAPNLFFHGYYVEAMWFLTGENRNYNRDLAIYEAVTPFSSFFPVRTADGICTGWGAWELMARYSWITLDDENIEGGELANVTLGVNWYLATRTRVTFNYIHALLDRNAIESEANIFGTRFQVVW